MYYKKNLDFVALIWEDLAYQIDNINSKNQDKMFYPRFKKIIIHHFLTKDNSISWRNKMFMHTTRDDSVLGTMRFISRHADTQVYGVILPQAMANQALLNSDAYKTYYAIASRAEPPMSRKSQKKFDSSISSEESPSKKKSAKVKKVATAKPKPTKKKAPVKADRGKGLNVLSEVALSEADQLKEATKRSKKDFHISHASGSGVLDVPKYDSKSEKESWGDSGEEDEDDENDLKINVMMTESRFLFLISLALNTMKKKKKRLMMKKQWMKKKMITKELYDDVNVNLGNEDTKITNADQGGSDQQNVSQESGFKQVEEDTQVTLTPVLETQNTDKHVQSSSVSSDFTRKLLNL
ncbi:hypothetical protein Tco_0315993 [Tanacetum coccineum]